MNPEDLLFPFNINLSEMTIPESLNNPFSSVIPSIANSAAKEFQQYIRNESPNWEHDFKTEKGKMFGVLVVRKSDNTLRYLGTVSGKLSGTISSHRFVPSVFDDTLDDYFINRGMSELKEISLQIKNARSEIEEGDLREMRKQKSNALQKWLFENYIFLNTKGKRINVIQIFKDSSEHENPPAAAGECAAPKLLNYALEHQLTPIAIAEFWWGMSPKNNEREHLGFYPACKNKCRPILEYMLNDDDLYNSRRD